IRNQNITKWDYLHEIGIIKQGTIVIKGEQMFPRVDMKAEVNHIKELMNESIVQPEEDNLNVPIKEEIDLPDFTQLDLRVAKVIEAEKMKNADKLLKIQ